MMRKVLIVSVVAAAVAGIVWFKSTGTSATASDDAAAEAVAASETPSAPADEATTGASTSSTETPATDRPTVMLFANPAEADTSCGCGQIIRKARRAGESSEVAFEEVDVTAEHPLKAQYNVRVSPTVLVVGKDGEVRRRFEGESPEVVSKIESTVERLTAGASADPSSRK